MRTIKCSEATDYRTRFTVVEVFVDLVTFFAVCCKFAAVIYTFVSSQTALQILVGIALADCVCLLLFT